MNDSVQSAVNVDGFVIPSFHNLWDNPANNLASSLASGFIEDLYFTVSMLMTDSEIAKDERLRWRNGPLTTWSE